MLLRKGDRKGKAKARTRIEREAQETRTTHTGMRNKKWGKIRFAKSCMMRVSANEEQKVGQDSLC